MVVDPRRLLSLRQEDLILHLYHMPILMVEDVVYSQEELTVVVVQVMLLQLLVILSVVEQLDLILGLAPALLVVLAESSLNINSLL
jgi:hypothetical protein